MEKKVYYHDTDAGGVVYYGNYLKFLEESRTEFLLEKGLNVKDFHEKGIFYAVKECHIRYQAPARYGDVLKLTANIKKTSAFRIFFHQTIAHKESGRILVDADVTLVCLDKTFKPQPIPEDLLSRL